MIFQQHQLFHYYTVLKGVLADTSDAFIKVCPQYAVNFLFLQFEPAFIGIEP